MYRRSPEIPGGLGDRVFQGEECDRDGGKERNFTSEHFWARGYAVSTVGAGS